MKRYPPAADEVLEAFRRWLNSQRSASYVVVAKPDETNRSTKDIDYLLEDSRISPSTLAVEVSSIWRSEEAGGEDAFFAKWWMRVQARAEGRVNGIFHVGMPVRVPDGLDPNVFADSLLDVIERDKIRLEEFGRQAQGLRVAVQGVTLGLMMFPGPGSSIEYGRFRPNLSSFPERVKAMLSEKAPKLSPYKTQGIETWIVAYNTAWTIMTPTDTERIIASLLTPEYAQVDHVGICICDPPNDAWMIVVPWPSPWYQSNPLRF